MSEKDVNLNLRGREENTYDAIVIGSGVSGGWAAKELTEKGLKVLMLERGHDLKHPNYETAFKHPWEFKYRNRLTHQQREGHPFLSRDYPYGETNAKYWFDDMDAPYGEKKRFDWYRPNIVGGKSVMWGRQSYRLSPMDFEANLKEGVAVDWPIRYKDLEPWYSYVEKFAGISGEKLGLEVLPDSEFLPPMELNCVEKHVAKRIKENYTNRVLTIGRVANLTQAHNGRGSCQYRNLCSRGCPYGAFFCTQATTLPAAVKTGNLTLRPRAIVNSIIFDEQKNKATGVRVIDADENKTTEYFAKIIFVCASTVGSTFVLLNSMSNRFPNGLGNNNDIVGRYLMDHHFRCGASGTAEGFEDQYLYGRRANGIYIPRFRNVGADRRDYFRGFGYQGGASRGAKWQGAVAELGFGADFKERITEPGGWSMGMVAFGETLPYHDNRVYLDKEKLDKWGQPTLTFDCEFKENEKLMRKDMMADAAEMLEAAGIKNVNTWDAGSFPGMGIHEMGTARMGRDPKTSVLNAFNQVWDCKNVFVTDGAAMTSISCVNPSLTFMALTARAADFAVNELKRGNL
jgi:choline dehydrogenase-like flavoprotein